MSFITDQYRKLNEDLHASNAGYGYRHLDTVMMLMKEFGTQDILDYGCGKSTLAINLGFPIKQYDPAIPKYAALPEAADIVTCTDVLEHIEPYYIDEVLNHLQSLTRKVCFASIATGPAKKVLADGRNAHLIQKPAKWWLDRILDRFELANFIATAKDFRVILLTQPKV